MVSTCPKCTAAVMAALLVCCLLAACSPSAGAKSVSAGAEGRTRTGEGLPLETAAAELSGETANKGGAGEVIVFAAASMQETLDEIRELYADVRPDVELVYNFDSSGTLKTQIEEGASCGIFISAAQKQMNELDQGTDEEPGLDLIAPGTRMNLLENKVTLAVPKGNPQNITGFADMAAKLQNGEILMAVGNSDVPVGQYTQRVFAYLGLDEEELAQTGCLTYGTNVKEVATQISEGAAACGIIYATDAFSAGLEVVAEATPEMCGRVIYPAAVLARAADMEEAEAFLRYLTSEPAVQVFESVGFSPAPADAQ